MPEDLLKFGMIPEFVGRLPVITSVHNLDREALIRILTEPRNALVRQYRRLFELDGVDLEFTDDALEAVADQAILRGTGARGLRAILEEVLMSVMYEVPSRKDVERRRHHRRVGAREREPDARAARRRPPHPTRKVRVIPRGDDPVLPSGGRPPQTPPRDIRSGRPSAGRRGCPGWRRPTHSCLQDHLTHTRGRQAYVPRPAPPVRRL